MGSSRLTVFQPCIITISLTVGQNIAVLCHLLVTGSYSPAQQRFSLPRATHGLAQSDNCRRPLYVWLSQARGVREA